MFQQAYYKLLPLVSASFSSHAMPYDSIIRLIAKPKGEDFLTKPLPWGAFFFCVYYVGISL